MARAVSPRHHLRIAVVLLISIAMAACGTPGGRRSTMGTLEPLRISELLDEPDPARRASLQLIDQGLEADIVGNPSRARSRYERALQVDPSNPYAYMAIARQQVEGAKPEGALGFLDKSRALLRAEGDESPRVLVHIVGLRGGALYGSGRTEEGVGYLREARAAAPGVWGDGVLTAEELR